MGAFFKVGSKVTITAKSPVPVAGSGEDHTGRTGKVRGYVNLDSDDVIHIIDLDEPFFVPNQVPNPQGFGPGGPTGRPIHGIDQLPNQKVDWIEVPGSCLK